MKKRSELVYWLALQKILHAQPLIANQMLTFFGTPAKVFDATKVEDRDTLLDACECDIEYCRKEAIEVITEQDPLYPALLKEIPDRPILIMIKGDKAILNGPCIAIVGARKASAHGKDIAFEIAQGLAQSGMIVVSGMAYGIDASAHLGALTAGKTIAVWGSGINCCYPPVFHDLSQKIANSGCIVSEFPLGTRPFKENFPQRNRIISGLSLGTVVVEAAAKSGSLITAKFALDQGREVFAVPGLAGATLSQGTHMLLRNGATFVENAEDVINIIAPQI